ncbi:hypothetical protein RB195_021007 [Necator americanus]|uniref:Uncharacterized protein n=1 Tax=Necator americanus TaxID=51031 RepID=A0ABR1CLP3_NECAM
MLRASRVLTRPKSLERLGQAVARSTSRGPIKETRTAFTDIPAQLTPSTREAMAAAKEASKVAATVTRSEQQKPEILSTGVNEANDAEEQMKEDDKN